MNCCFFPKETGVMAWYNNNNNEIKPFFFLFFLIFILSLILWLFVFVVHVVVWLFYRRRSQRAKLRSVLHYFQRLNERPPEGHVTFARQVRHSTQYRTRTHTKKKKNPFSFIYCLFTMIWQIWYRSVSSSLFYVGRPSLVCVNITWKTHSHIYSRLERERERERQYRKGRRCEIRIS